MIRHIVLWKLDNSYSSQEKEKILTELRQKLFALKDLVPEVLIIEVYLNSDKAPASNFDIMLDSVFNSLDDLNTYQLHPDHIKVANYIKSIKLQRSAIDFQF